MASLIVSLILLLFALLLVVVRKTYYSIPVVELRRRARQHDPMATKFYRVVAYGNSLRSLLWFLISVSTAVGIILLARDTPIWLSIIVFLGLLWATFTWLPHSRVTSIGARLTLAVTPVFAWLLNYLHPGLSRGSDAIAKRRHSVNHTGIYERDDLLNIIERQQQQADNRVTLEELEIAKRALHFTDHQVADVMTPRKQVKTVNADDTIGPILIDELHKQDEDSVLVHDKPKGQIIGSLSVSHLNIKSSGKVRDVMDTHVYFVHEDDTLSEALHAFFVTNRPLFVVVNNAEEYVGIITVQTMLEQLLGHIPGDDFDQYANPAAVAHRHQKPKQSVKPDDADITVELE